MPNDIPRPVDLHTHSTASDGTLSPTELVDHARSCGVAGLALTDHDTLAGIDEARRRSNECHLRFIAGVELSTARSTLPDVHLLGYCVDGAKNPPLLELCDSLRVERQARAKEIVRRLELAGADVPWDIVAAKAASAPVGRPHIAQALIECGLANGIADAFRRWLAPGTPGYLPKRAIDTIEAVSIVRKSGGVPVLAHPGTLKLSEDALGRFLGELVEAGLAGLECYWARHDAGTVEMCERLAGRFDLLMTGGSDFHGANKPDIVIARLPQGRQLALEILTAIEERAA